MKHEILQEWLDKTLQDSADLEYDIFLEELDDTFGWGEILELMWYKLPQPCAGGILLTGPDGCGKHTAAAHMVRLAVKRGRLGVVFLDGADFYAQSLSWLQERLNLILDQFYDQEQGLCLVMENLEDLPWRKELLTFLGRTLRDYSRGTGNVQDAFPALFLVLLDRQEETVPPILRNKLRLCRMSLPNLVRRKQFLAKYAANIRSFVPMDQFAQATEGASYAQLRALVENVSDLVDCRDEQLSEEEFLRFLVEQMPLQTERQLTVLTETVRELIARIPDLIRTVDQGVRTEQGVVVHPSVPAMQPPVVDADYVQKRRQEVEKISVRELSVQLFGEESTAMLLNA